MDKYQQALDELILDERHDIEEKAKLLQELVDKATPKILIDKKIRVYNGSCVIEQICPNCKNTLYCEYDFCGCCGQALDWSK